MMFAATFHTPHSSSFAHSSETCGIVYRDVNISFSEHDMRVEERNVVFFFHLSKRRWEKLSNLRKIISFIFTWRQGDKNKYQREIPTTCHEEGRDGEGIF
jgi:hypothetical protein